MKKMTEEQLELLAKLRAEGKTWKQMESNFQGFSANALRKTFYRKKDEPLVVKAKEESGTPKVLIFDVETSPLEVYCWGLYDQNIGLEMVKKDWSILSFSAKWLHDSDDKVMYCDTRDKEDPKDDSDLLKVIHSLLDEADCVLVQNGARFDVPKLQARFVMNGMKPVSSFRIIDTLRIAKRHFSFTSNKLAYMTDKLNVKYKKLDHGEFAGFKLWSECLKGNPKAWDAMREYNIYDVLSLQELYYKLAPWDKTIRFSAFNEDTKDRCDCGNEEFKRKGFIFTNTAKYERHICTNCGKEFRGSKNIATKENKGKLR